MAGRNKGEERQGKALRPRKRMPGRYDRLEGGLKGCHRGD